MLGAALGMIVVHLLVHEAAHAVALRSLGGRVAEAGLGLPVPPRLKLTIDRRTAPALRVSLSPWVIAAYVQPDDASATMLKTLPYRDRAWFYGSGVVANTVLSGVMLTAACAIHSRWLLATACAAGTSAVWVARRVITASLPALGLMALAVLVWALVDRFGERVGPAGMVTSFAEFPAAGADLVLLLGAAIGVAFAVGNCVPVFPFDGGRVTDAALRELAGARVARVFQAATGVVAMGLIVYPLVSDLVF